MSKIKVHLGALAVGFITGASVGLVAYILVSLAIYSLEVR